MQLLGQALALNDPDSRYESPYRDTGGTLRKSRK